MFGEDRDDDDAAAARAHDFWPPAGFRDRLKNSAFHHHPKSSDQVIQQLRDELDKQRQMFFDRVAVPSSHWESASQSPHSATMRGGFPFSDGTRRTVFGPDRTSIPHHFHEDIPSWLHDDGIFRRQRWPSNGSGRSAGSSSSTGSNPEPTQSNTAGSTGRSDSPCRTDAPRVHKPAARSATGDFPTSSNPPAGSNQQRVFRASSAPPVAPEASANPRFASTIHHAPPANNSKPESTSSSGGVRHIPIMVEGRDEPLLPKVVEEDNHTKEANKKAIPMPFYPAASAPPEEKRDSSIPIPLPYDRLTEEIPNRAPVQSNAGRPSELDQIERIRRETETLLPRIQAFQGERNDRDFIYLDEMLTRLLLKLDNVPVEGRDDIRLARKGAISAIQECIQLLESKIRSGIDRSNSTTIPDENSEKDLTNKENPESVENSTKRGKSETLETSTVKEADAVASSPIVKVMSSPAVIVPDLEKQHDSNNRHISQLVINIGGDDSSPAPVVDQ